VSRLAGDGDRHGELDVRLRHPTTHHVLHLAGGQLIDETATRASHGDVLHPDHDLSGGAPSPDTFLLSLRLDSAPTRQIQYTFNVTRVRDVRDDRLRDYTDAYEPTTPLRRLDPSA